MQFSCLGVLQVRLNVAARLHAQMALAVHLQRTFEPPDAGSAIRAYLVELQRSALRSQALRHRMHMCSCGRVAVACLQTAELSWSGASWHPQLTDSEVLELSANDKEFFTAAVNCTRPPCTQALT